MLRRPRFSSLLGAWLCVFAGLAVGPATDPAVAQGASYCNITRITTRTLANAVEITVQADGLMQVDWDGARFFNIEAFYRGRMEDIWKPVSVLPFRIANARSQISPFTDVGTYTASHVEVSIPPDARDGVGVDLRVVLFRDVIPVSIQTPYGFEPPNPPSSGSTVSVQLTPDRTRLLILITSDRQVLPSLDRKGPPPGAGVTLEVAADGDSVTINALNADIRNVIQQVAHSTGRDVTADSVLERTVSLALPSMPFDEALEAIAMACGLTLDRSGEVFRVTDGQANSLPAYEQGAFEVIPLRHITAASARANLPDVLLRYLHLDERLNALTVFGPKHLIQKVRADIAVLDRPVPQIEVEAQIVEFASTDERDRLLRVRNVAGGESLEADAGMGDITFLSAAPLPAGFSAGLRALIRSGKARLRAQPRSVVRNGDTATLFVGQQRFIKVVEYNAIENVDYVSIMGVDLGVSLRVTPWTGDGHDVFVDVAPQVSTISEREPRTGLPTVFTRNASASLRLRNGDTAVIGGLSENQPERRYRKIPILGDLPLIGGLFRTVEHRRTQRELTLFVTARVLTDVGTEVPAAKHEIPNGDNNDTP